MIEFKPVLPGYQSYLYDESRLAGQADFIVFPEDTAGMAEAVRQGRAEGMPLTIQGARTGITGGAVPSGGLILSTEKMVRTLGCSTNALGKAVLRIQAGMNFAALNRFLSRGIPADDWSAESKACFKHLNQQSRHRFPPNPTETSAALGGAFATNARGPNSLRFGATGVHIEELVWVSPKGSIQEIVRGRYRFDDTGCPLPDGSRLKADTAIPRGVSVLLYPAPGTDLIDFLAGSEGLAGIVTELGLRLEPVPAITWAVVYFFTTEEGASDFAAAISGWKQDSPGGQYLSSVEYYDKASLELIRQSASQVTALRQLPQLSPEWRSAIHLELEGEDADGFESALMEQLALFTGLGGKEDDTWAAAGQMELEKYRLLRHAVPELINAEIDRIRQSLPDFYKTAADFMVSPERIAPWNKRYHQDIANAELHGFVFGHILEGRFHVNLLAENKEEFCRCRALLEAWASDISMEGGILAAENGIGRLKKPLVSRFLSSERLGQIREILNQLGNR